jgi:predicted glycosyltransferase involved in capsule biosynthesis
MRKISSIIPLRADNFDFYRQRLDLRKNLDVAEVETIVVDDGSPDLVATQVENYCKKHEFKYVRIESSEYQFSLSRSRNYGVEAASCDWIIMEDADITYEKSFYKKLAAEVELMDETPFNFFSVPVVYLKQEISESIFNSGEIDSFIPRILMAAQFENPKGDINNKIVESFSPATALFVVRKSTLMHIGGYDNFFEGWGGEDRDVAFRLLAFNEKIRIPVEFGVTKKTNLNDTVEYKGWRSLYRLTGDYLAAKGLYGFHLFHHKLDWRSDEITTLNFKYAENKALSISKKQVLIPKFDKSKKINVIIGFNPHISNSQIYDVLENIIVIDDAKNQNINAIVEKISSLDVQNIIFWNPYGSEWRLNLYEKLRVHNYQIIVAERGALPNSFYFDAKGLCIESDSYQEYKNITVINESERVEVKNYLFNLRYSSSALESQSPRIGAGAVRLKLNIPEDKKIIFVPLQVESDTVTNHFIEPGRSYQDFLNEIRMLPLFLPADWVVVIKNHPLNNGKIEVDGCIVGDNFHINDLIEAASIVCLFNSGCGLLSMAFSRPVYYFGKCFYAISGVNENFLSAHDLVEKIKNSFVVDKALVERFYYYLLYKFYSFATSEKVGGKLKLYYSTIRIPGFPEVVSQKYVELTSNSIILGRYKRYIDSLEKGAPLKSNIVQENFASISKDEREDSLSIAKKSMLYRSYFFIVRTFLSASKRKKLVNNPKNYFMDSKNIINRSLGNFIFPD